MDCSSASSEYHRLVGFPRQLAGSRQSLTAAAPAGAPSWTRTPDLRRAPCQPRDATAAPACRCAGPSRAAAATSPRQGSAGPTCGLAATRSCRAARHALRYSARLLPGTSGQHDGRAGTTTSTCRGATWRRRGRLGRRLMLHVQPAPRDRGSSLSRHDAGTCGMHATHPCRSCAGLGYRGIAARPISNPLCVKRGFRLVVRARRCGLSRLRRGGGRRVVAGPGVTSPKSRLLWGARPVTLDARAVPALSSRTPSSPATTERGPRARVVQSLSLRSWR